MYEDEEMILTLEQLEEMFPEREYVEYRNGFYTYTTIVDGEEIYIYVPLE